jgi:DNA-binding NarL/FixJ family response regulator
MKNSYGIFLVDDHQVVLDGLRAALSTYAHVRVDGTASSYDEAMTSISDPAFKSEIIVTDHAIGSGLDGLDLCRTSKILRPQQRVALLTMHSHDAIRYRAQRAGVDVFIPKSTPVSIIVAELDNLASNHASTDQRRSAYDNSSSSPTTPTTELSARELEVLQLIVCEELTTKQIAERLHRSVQTIESHRAHLFQKLGVDSVVGLVKYAMMIGMSDGHKDHSGNA